MFYLFYFFFLLIFVFETGSHVAGGQPGTHYIAKDVLELLIYLPVFLKWDYRHGPSCLVWEFTVRPLTIVCLK